MAKNTQRAEAKKKKQQKVMLIALVPLLLIVMFIQVPKLMKSQSLAGPKTVEEGSSESPLPTVTTPGPVIAVQGGGDAAFSIKPGQLPSLSHFASRDPFGLPPQPSTVSDDSGNSSGGSRGGGGGKSGPKSGGEGKTPENAPYISAMISVNGTAEAVHVNGTFPAAAPVFVLKSIGPSSAQIAVWGGSFSSGSKALTLRKGNKITLMNAADGTRYVLVLLSVSRKAASGTSTPTTTTPVSTSTTSTSTTSTEPPPPVPPTSTT